MANPTIIRRTTPIAPKILPWGIEQKRMIGIPTIVNNQITWGTGVKSTVTDTLWTERIDLWTTYNNRSQKTPDEVLPPYDPNNPWASVVTPTAKIPNTPTGWTKDKSVALMTAWKSWVTNNLAWGRTDNLPWVTKYAGIDKGYWNNQAGIDLVNKQNELDTLSEWEKAQRLAWAYNPTPTVATAQNPVIKKTLDKPQEQTITPEVLQGADMNTLNSTLDELNYKVNVEGKQLTKDEYLTYASAKRQLQDMMKPQALTGGLDGLIANKENEIKQATDESKINNEQELADFTRSQEVYKQAEIDAIEQADEESKKTLWFILGWQGAWQGTFAVEQIGKITQNSLAKKQALNEAVQAKIDLYGSQLRKDSQQTIQAMKDRLDSYYMKAAEFDVDNIKQMNEYNAKEWASKIEQIDKMMALAQSQAMAMQPLTEQEKAQAQAFAGNLYDNEWNFQNNVFEMLYKVNPKLANAAVMQGTAIQKERLSNDLAMRWLDADIKRAQLNKLLNPDVDYKVVANDDWTYTRTWSDWSVAIVDPKSWASTSAVETIKKWEWFRDKAYQDSTGTWTIGYWFTNVDWKPVQPWMTMDRWTADNLLWQEISQRQNFMNYITVPLSDSQKAALSSFEFNLWSWIREKNAKPILDKINAGDLQGAWNLMKQYAYSKWQKLQGLSNRRNEEARLLLDKWQKTAEYKTDKDATKEITGLRKEFNALPEVKNYKQVVTSYKTIEEQAKKATPAGDLSMIFSYMKLLDPTSTVREWEFANAQNAASIPDQVRNAYNKAAQGTRLNDRQRQDFLNWAKVQLKSYEDLHNQALENYKTYITMWWNPNDIWEFGDVSWSSIKQATDTALQAGGQTQTTADPLWLWI